MNGHPAAAAPIRPSPTFLTSLLALCTGCLGPPHGSLSPAERLGFRAVAIKALEEAAFGDSPAQRMQAIEAFKEVAPQDGMELLAIPLNIENEYAGVSFAALMAAGEIGAAELMDQVRTRAESPDPHVKIGALFALHRLGSTGRTGELAQFLLHHPEARVRANAALAIGRLGGTQHVELLKMALRREQKTAAKLQILESLAFMSDADATNRLMFDGYSEYPDQAAVALMMLANARSPAAENLFWTRLQKETDFPEIQLQAARGLAHLGYNDGFGLALRHLFFNSPKHVDARDTAGRQIERVRGMAALALEAMAEPASLAALKKAFKAPLQSAYVRLAVARAAIRTIDRVRDLSGAQALQSGIVARAADPRNRHLPR